MPANETISNVLLVVGIVFLAISLLADVIGIGQNPGIGENQTAGIVIGAAIAAIGLFLRQRKS
jgi:hypothetical protein